jgi:hypothetical protein
VREAGGGPIESGTPGKERLQINIGDDHESAQHWEYGGQGYYPIDLSNEAYELGVNYVVYALTR